MVVNTGARRGNSEKSTTGGMRAYPLRTGRKGRSVRGTRRSGATGGFRGLVIGLMTMLLGVPLATFLRYPTMLFLPFFGVVVIKVATTHVLYSQKRSVIQKARDNRRDQLAFPVYQRLYITEPGGGEEAQRNIHTILFIPPGERYRVPGRRNPGIPGSKPIHNAPRQYSGPPDRESPPYR